MLRDGGTLFVYGMAEKPVRLPVSPYDVFRRELTIKGSFAQSFSFDRAVRALRTGRVRADGLVTHRFGLSTYARAIDTVRHDRSCVKAVVESLGTPPARPGASPAHGQAGVADQDTSSLARARPLMSPVFHFGGPGSATR